MATHWHVMSLTYRLDRKTLRVKIDLCLFGIMILIIALSPWTHWYYTISLQGEYHKTIIAYLMIAVLCIYLITDLIYLWYGAREYSLRRKLMCSCMLVCFLTVAFRDVSNSQSYIFYNVFVVLFLYVYYLSLQSPDFYVDNVTGSFNRNGFEESIYERIAYHVPTACFMVRVRNFGAMASVYGDEVLLKVQKLILELIEKKCHADVIFHVGSSSFAILLDTKEQVEELYDYLKENHLQPLNLGKRGVINTEPDITKARESLSEEGFYSFKLTREERVSFAAVLMICSDDYITLSEIADQLFVSRSTVIQDLEHIKTFCRERHLYVLSHSNKGLLLEGREIDKRNLLIDMIQSGSSIFKVEPIFQHLTQCLSKNLKIDLEDISMIEKIINEAEHIYGRFLTDRSFTQLRNYFQLSLYRLRKSHYVKYGGEKNSKWEMAKGMIDQIQQFIVKEIPDTEVYYIADVLDRKSTRLNSSHSQQSRMPSSA